MYYILHCIAHPSLIGHYIPNIHRGIELDVIDIVYLWVPSSFHEHVCA